MIVANCSKRMITFREITTVHRAARAVAYQFECCRTNGIAVCKQYTTRREERVCQVIYKIFHKLFYKINPFQTFCFFS